MEDIERPSAKSMSMRGGGCSRPRNDSRVFDWREIKDAMLQLGLIIGKPCNKIGLCCLATEAAQMNRILKFKPCPEWH